MSTNLHSLFDSPKYEKQKSVDQIQFEKENQRLLSAFPKIVEKCFAATQKMLAQIDPNDRANNLPATLMSGYLRRRMLYDFPEYCWAATRSRFKMAKNGYFIYVKKLSESARMPSNVMTKESMRIYNNLRDASVFIGYTTTKTYSHITGVFAKCIDGKTPIWELDLNLFAQQNDIPIVHVKVPPIPTGQNVKVKASAKKKNAKE